jgi:phospholipase/carboxylesterase/glyoxalase family protein
LTTAPEFVHVFRPPAAPGAPVLLLLHGTGGDECDLLPLADALVPEAGVLSPRGRVLEQGRPRFFRRLAEGVFDLEDLARRTRELADFVAGAAGRYGFDRDRLVAVGFSNGANMAASLLLTEPDLLAAAALFRAMVPFEPDPLPRLPGTPVLLAGGRDDPLVPRAETERLARLLEHAGAEVTVAWQSAGHGLVPADVARAREWLAGVVPRLRRRAAAREASG